MIQLYFRRKHLPSGRIYIAQFNASHTPLFEHLPIRHLELELRRTVDRWNAQQRDTWHYTYIGIRNEEVVQYEKEQSCLKSAFI